MVTQLKWDKQIPDLYRATRNDSYDALIVSF